MAQIGFDLDKLWAKSAPYQPLWKHLLDTAAVSLTLGNPLERFGWSAEQVALLVGLHDVGKADAGFQHQINDYSAQLKTAGFPVTADSRCRHERLSAAFVKGKLEAAGVDDYTVMAVTLALVAHHGDWHEGARGVGEAYARAREDLYAMLGRALCVKAVPTESPADMSAFGMLLCGHIVLCDWIASNEKFYTDARLRNGSVKDPAAYLEAARSVAREWVESLDLGRMPGLGMPEKIVAAPRPLQKALLDNAIPPGLVIIEAPMGEGKTEAAWILAEKWRSHGYDGMYMALPTMATSDSLHGRYRDGYLRALGRGEDVKLVHGMAWLRDDQEPERAPNVGEPRDGDRDLAAAWFRPTRRALLAAHGVGTVDQAMLAGMHVKFGFLRLYGLTGRVLVIDEVHAYDAYMSAILVRLLQWCACLKIPVILLSATLSARQRAAMAGAYGALGADPDPKADYPLITVVEPGKQARLIPVAASSSRMLKIEKCPGMLGDAERTATLAQTLAGGGGSCCVILNTVKQAQAVYRALKLPDAEKLLFHARFSAEDRKRIADRVLALFGKERSQRPQRFVLVATQVVEQSLDVDFDHMISEIAPVDLLLQRSGRLHRHSKRPVDPVLHVLLSESGGTDFDSSRYVYYQKPLLRTLAILNGLNQVSLPRDFRELIARCYGTELWQDKSVDWERVMSADQEWDADFEVQEGKAGQFSLNLPKARFFRPVNNDPSGDDSDDGNGWRGSTRLGANDRTVVLLDQAEIVALDMESLSMGMVRTLYRRAVKLAGYLPLDVAADGFRPALKGSGKLRGLTLLPLVDGKWRGRDDKGNLYEVAYDPELGLLAGRQP